MTDDPQVLVVLARLEGKLDATVAAHSTDIKNLHGTKSDHENRIRVLEGKSTISPGQLWAGLVGTLGAGAALAGIVQAFLGK